MRHARLVTLVLALIISIGSITGGTIAWFTDSVESASNVITSGNLDIEVQYTLDGENWADLEGANDLFQKGLWEPGHTEVVALKIENKGTLAAKYTANTNIVNETIGKTKDGKDIALSDILTIKTLVQEAGIVGDITVGLAFDREDGVGYEKTVAFKEANILPAEKELQPGSAHYVIIQADMAETVGNEANHDGTNIPSINFGIDVCATQFPIEKDSFGKDYDADATYPPKTVDIATEDDFAKVKEGNVINLTQDITLSNTVTLPADTVLRGNGKQITGTIAAGGDLTIEGHVKVTSFSASYYDRTITIGEDACLEITGTGRMTLGYGNTFSIIGKLENAKTTDKTSIQPSLIIPKGISITGGNDAVMNVTNAYVQIGNTTSKNSADNGTFTLNITNSIAEFTDQLTMAEPTSGMNPTFNINIKDSVLTTGTKFIVAAPNSNVVIDNSTVTLASYFRNSGKMELKNGSVLTGSTIQFGENGGNDGTTIVDGSTFKITATSAGHALDGKGTGELVLKNGATATVDYYKALTIDTDATSQFTGTKVM